MAIVVETIVRRASREESDRHDALVEAAMMELGGPPDGLMVHIGRPEGDGIWMCQVWRSEADMRPFYEGVVLSKFAEAGLTPEPPTISPLWSWGRP